MTAETICHSPCCWDGGFGRWRHFFFRRGRYAAREPFKNEPAAGRRGKLRWSKFASCGEADLPRVSLELVDPEIGIAAFRSRIEVHIELMGICGIVQRDRPLIDGSHATAAESASRNFDSCVRKHAAGNGLSFHFQFRNGPGALNQVQIGSHKRVNIELRVGTQVET
jgi:hypothetical protein